TVFGGGHPSFNQLSNRLLVAVHGSTLALQQNPESLSRSPHSCLLVGVNHRGSGMSVERASNSSSPNAIANSGISTFTAIVPDCCKKERRLDSRKNGPTTTLHLSIPPLTAKAK